MPGIVVTDAKSLFDHLSTTGSVPKERQTLIDLLVARDLIEENTLSLHWVPTTHQLADVLTKLTQPGEVMKRFLMEQKYAVIPTQKEEQKEAHRKELRQGQRKRGKQRKQAQS